MNQNKKTPAKQGALAMLKENKVLGSEVTPTKLVAIVGSLVIVIAIVGFFWLNMPGRAGATLDNDPSAVNLRTLGGAILQYADEHGVLPALPNAAALQKFAMDDAMKSNVWENPKTHEPYAPNPSLSGKKIMDFKAAEVVAVYEPSEDRAGNRHVVMLDGSNQTIGKNDWPKVKAASFIP